MTLKLLGELSDKKVEDFHIKVKNDKWIIGLSELFLGSLKIEELLKKVNSNDKRCDLYFYAACSELFISKDQTKALEYLIKCIETKELLQTEYFGATYLRDKIRNK